jgi:hypothetical protein
MWSSSLRSCDRAALSAPLSTDEASASVCGVEHISGNRQDRKEDPESISSRYQVAQQLLVLPVHPSSCQESICSVEAGALPLLTDAWM